MIYFLLINGNFILCLIGERGEKKNVSGFFTNNISQCFKFSDGWNRLVKLRTREHSVDQISTALLWDSKEHRR
jgi:hypothetical protein